MTALVGSVRKHPWWVAIAGIIIAGGVWFSWDMLSLVFSKDTVDHVVPQPARLAAASGQDVFRIDPNESSAKVEVVEELAGVDQTVELTTKAIGGDFGIDRDDLANSAIGEIQVDIQQLDSDNSLRDKAIRIDYLESRHYPIATLKNVKVSGLTGSLKDGETKKFTIDGDLTVKKTTKPVSFEAEATLDGDRLTATATAEVLLSDFEVGPINKIGLVSTKNEAKITLDLVARNSDGYTPPAKVSIETAEVEVADGAPSFSKTVQPILENNCASCHQGRNVGAHAFTLNTAGDAAAVADGLAVVTKARYMPPWPPSSEGVPVRHDRSLPDEDIEAIQAWAESGAPLDVAEEAKIVDRNSDSVTLRDVDLTMPLPEPYEGDISVKDDYRCQIMDPKLTKREAMVGYLLEPDSTETVHHALIFQYSGDEKERLEKIDAEAEGPGWPCVGMTGFGAGEGRLVAGWVPGARPIEMEDGAGFEFMPGDLLVTQIHYHYEGLTEPDQSKLNIDWADDPDSIIPLRTRTLVGPVELPCPEEAADGPLCERDAAVAEAAKTFPPLGGIIPNVLHQFCGTTVEEVAALSDGKTAKTVCEFPLRSGGEIVDFLGHEHEIGKSYRMTLNPGTPEEKVLLDIPHWDFNWQLNYQPVDPIPVKAGDVIGVECTWDRALRYDPEPRYIVFSEGTEDEMCFSTITMIPPRDAAAEDVALAGAPEASADEAGTTTAPKPADAPDAVEPKDETSTEGD